MAKKSNDVPNPNSVINRDVIQRLNFLYQASVYLSSCNPPNSPNLLSTRDLAKDYISTMRAVGQKTTVRMYALSSPSGSSHLDRKVLSDPAVKRTLCRGCNLTLIPGATATIRIKSLCHKSDLHCLYCSPTSRIRIPRQRDIIHLHRL